VQSIDIASGAVRSQWNSLDHVALRDSYLPPPKTPAAWDAFHLNSVDEEAAGGLLLSARSTWAVYQLQPGSQALQWTLGGKHGTLRVAPGARMAWQHNAVLHPDGTLTAFDDETRPGASDQSRGVQLRLGGGSRPVTVLHSFEHATAITSASQGSLQELPGGRWLVGWGQVPYISEYAGNGSLLFDAHLPFAAGSYRALAYPWQGTPAHAPAVAATVLGAQSTAVYASWNGATGVAAWRVLAGTRRDQLYDFTTVPRGGFETQVLLEDPERYVEVQALGANGRTLASSPLITSTGSLTAPAP
jgi:hypothetical protein